MANLRVAMDAAFWDLEVSSPQNLEGTALSVPGEPVPLALARAGRTVRPQQLSFLANAFPLGLIPSFASTPPQKELGSFAIQSFLHGPATPNWWTGVVGQFRPRKLISSIKKEVMIGDELEMPAFRDIAKHFLDKSLYALGIFSQVSLTPDTSLLFNVERHGAKSGQRSKALLVHTLPDHDVTLQAAWPELFMDSKGTYWEVPASFSLDIASLVSDSGLRYRFGLHKNSGQPGALHSSSAEVPLALLPGICTKAAFSLVKSRDIWREKENKSPKVRRSEKEPAPMSSYDVRFKEPHATISGIIGGTFAAWFGGGGKSDATLPVQLGHNEAGGSVSVSMKKRYPISADLFGSLCYTLQHGKFKNDFNDFTRVDARLDISSASAFLKGASYLLSDIVKGQVDREVNPVAAPRLNIVLQQQVAGPIIFRVDSRVSLTSPSGKHVPHIEDVMYCLSYSLRMLQSGKILAWFSPKRKEAMVELRLFEF